MCYGRISKTSIIIWWIQTIEALSLIKSNNDIFKVEHLENNENNDENFADAKILTVILEKRRDISQLLISNDQRLTSDAYRFNDLESFYGSKVSVCYIGSNSEMNMYDCIKTKSTKKQPEKIIYKIKL